jgi:hypothetical protein
MYIPHTICTGHGPHFLPLAPMVRVTLTVAELHAMAALVAKQGADAEAEGRSDVAQRLRWRAVELREAGR